MVITSDPHNLRIVAAVAAALALVALYCFFTRLRRERLLADTPLVRIRSAAQGYVMVAGLAAPAGPAAASAPLSERSCVWWSYEIARKERDSKGNSRWHTVESGASVELFMLRDEDAQCLVGPVKAEVTPTTHDIWYGSEPRPSGPPPAQAIRTAFGAGGWRYTERLLHVGDRLSVLGELRSHSEVGGGESAVAQKLRQWKQDQATLLTRFDTNHDGRIDAQEWEAARAAAARESQAQTLQSGIERVSIITEPANGEPFLIAPLSPQALERRERRFAGLFFALGLLCVIVCAWALNHASLLAGGPGR